MSMTATLTYRQSDAVGHGINNPKFATKLFRTKMSAHDVGAIDLLSQIVVFCHQRAIHQYEKIEFTRTEAIR